jgi:replicative DNA helicase
VTTGYAERRVLALLLANPERVTETSLSPKDFVFDYHGLIFGAIADTNTGEVLGLGLPDEVSRYALGLDENWTSVNLSAFAEIVRQDAAQRRFVRSVAKLRGGPRKNVEATR